MERSGTPGLECQENYQPALAGESKRHASGFMLTPAPQAKESGYQGRSVTTCRTALDTIDAFR